MSTSLKDKLMQDAQAKGVLNLKSSDVAEFTGKDEKKIGEAVQGDVTVPVQALRDPMVAAGAEADAGRTVMASSARSAGKEKLVTDLSDSEYSVLGDKVVISDIDRESFLKAVVSGGRFELPFSIFNDRVKGKIRSRSQAESHALLAQLNYECRAHVVNTELDYAMRIRNMLLAVQVSELNGERYAELAAPLQRLVKADGTTAEPGWLQQVDTWANKNEGLVSAIYHELRVFERKYWTMVNNACDQNFWNPAEST